MVASNADAEPGWLEGLLAERQVYVQGPGGPHFITISSRSRLLRLLGVAVLLLLTIGLTTLLALGHARLRAVEAELAAFNGDGSEALSPGAEDTAATGLRAMAAELEAAQAKVALLTGQLASVEQGRSRATGKLATLRKESASTLTTEIMADATIAGSMPASDSELDTLRERIAMLERERDAARAELAVLRARPPPPSIEPLQAQIAGLEAERVTLVGRQTELGTALANARNEAAAARAASTAAGVEIEQLKAQLAHPVLASPAVPPAELHQQLEVTLTELKERDQKLDEIRRRNSELERFIARRVPTPIAAPR